MSAMLTAFLLAAAAASGPDASATPRQSPSVGARATATVGVRIVSGARISMSEQQDSNLPALQQSSVRVEGGGLCPARLVEFN